MKIGIVTYYRSHNYGAMLQAFALCKTLQKMGHEAVFIDYWPKHQRNIYRLFAWEDFWQGGLRGRLGYMKNFVKTLLPKIIRRRNFNRFYREQIQPYVSSPRAKYDLVVYGSDQIWRKQGWGYGYNPVYFGINDLKTNKHVSYAASIGTLPDNDDDIEVIKRYIKHIDCVSVRESELLLFLNKHGFEDVVQVLDPTFLLSKEEWTSMAGQTRMISEPYLLFYDLQIGAFDMEEVERFAIKKNLKVVRLRGLATGRSKVNDRTVDGPYEFLNLICYADYVLTSSFHGLAFSIIFQKTFFCFLTNNIGRAESLLNTLGVPERLLTERKSLLRVKENKINWASVQEVLNEMRIKSLDYLNSSIELYL